MKPTLLILAAGAGSRFGGLKQFEPLGPNGEIIMDYSIHDALKAGFGKVVIIIRKDFLKDFERTFSKYKSQLDISYAFQEVNPKFEGIEHTADRQKPWGTVHAVLSASKHIAEPFAIINADDFYGKESFKLMAEFLKNNCTEKHWSLIGYQLMNTLSEHGGVTRGVCETNAKNFLRKVKECRGIRQKGNKIFYTEGDTEILLDKHSIVSMNFWGFHPRFFELAEKELKKFVSENSLNPQAEMTLPDLLQPLIAKGTIKVSVSKTNEKWFGVTFWEDRKNVARELKALATSGSYTEKLL